MSNLLHIVCLDAPSPPDYGGAIDMYYKIKSLSETGKEIILHYFKYNPARDSEGVQSYCKEIHSYNRSSFFHSSPLSQPYIVASRINKKLVKRLNADDYPILLEGLHCSGILPSINNKERVVLRMHNEEVSYYKHLAATEKSFLKKIYFKRESELLKKYQERLDKNCKIACLSQTDVESFKQDYHFQKVYFIPCFIPWQSIGIRPGFGEYCLYHGNMSVSENEEAANWLIESVFGRLSLPLVIAGKGISASLFIKAKKYPNIKLVQNPPIDELQQLVHDAHINVLPSMNRTGVKLKLLNALLNGRFCITNYNGIMGSGLEKFVTVTNSADEWISVIASLMKQDFLLKEIEERKKVLEIYNNMDNAKKLSELW